MSIKWIERENYHELRRLVFREGDVNPHVETIKLFCGGGVVTAPCDQTKAAIVAALETPVG